jgi:FtsP/CotA-like multicopper oxidase with cupredoxin domain
MVEVDARRALFTRRQMLGYGAAGFASLFVLPPLLASCAPQPTNALGAELVNPPMSTPTDGRLTGSLTAKIAEVDVGVGRMVRTYTYDGMLPGRTWELRPGDTIAIDLVNELPALDPAEQTASHDHGQTDAETGSDTVPDMTRPHAWTTTNLHTHGLHVSPEGNGDNVFRVIEPGTSGPVEIAIPEDHTGGFFWYHPHVHGGVKQQVRGGMAGALIIRGAIDEVPEVAAAQEKILVLQDLELTKDFALADPDPESPQGNFWPDDQEIWVVNGQYRPRITMRPGEVQRWRMVNAAASWMARLQLEGHPMHHLAYDGLTLDAPRERQDTLIVPGGRCEALVKAGGIGEYDLVLLPAFETPVTEPTPDATGYIAATTVPRVIATVRVEGDPVDMALPTTLPAYDPPMLPIARQREVSYTSHDDAAGNLLAFGIDGKPFDPDAEPYTMTLDTAEEWTVDDADDGFTHIFHIHINPFLVTHVNGEALEQPEWRDTYPLGPASFVFRTNITDFTGTFVQHCHYVDHEDMGMMEAIRVDP